MPTSFEERHTYIVYIEVILCASKVLTWSLSDRAMMEQIYMSLVLFLFWPLFFIYLYFLYEWTDRRPKTFGIIMGALIWAMVWPVTLAVSAYKRYKKQR